MREAEIEKHLVKRCKEENILCEKFKSPQRNNVPDRILIYKGAVIFLELKATDAKPTEAQERDHDRRRKQGITVLWTDSKEGVEIIIEAIKKEMSHDGSINIKNVGSTNNKARGKNSKTRT